MFSSNKAQSPMGEMNTTPLIDVMLVLLIMFIITIPVATHETQIELRGSCEPDCDQIDLSPIRNKLVITPQDNLIWNAQPISQGELVSVLAQSVALPVEPELQFEPDAQASYETTLQVIDIVKTSGVTRFGFVGNERYGTFASAQ